MKTKLSQKYPENGNLRLFYVVATLEGEPFTFSEFGENAEHALKRFTMNAWAFESCAATARPT
jgi:hypothetical protein